MKRVYPTDNSYLAFLDSKLSEYERQGIEVESIYISCLDYPKIRDPWGEVFCKCNGIKKNPYKEQADMGKVIKDNDFGTFWGFTIRIGRNFKNGQIVRVPKKGFSCSSEEVYNHGEFKI